jgi:hypothetical protein
MLPEPANTMIASTTENLWGTGALEALSMAVSGYYRSTFNSHRRSGDFITIVKEKPVNL